MKDPMPRRMLHEDYWNQVLFNSQNGGVPLSEAYRTDAQMNLLFSAAGWWIHNERHYMNERRWIEEGAVPGRVVDMGVIGAIDHIIGLDYCYAWEDGLCPKVAATMRKDPRLREELANLYLFGEYGNYGIGFNFDAEGLYRINVRSLASHRADVLERRYKHRIGSMERVNSTQLPGLLIGLNAADHNSDGVETLQTELANFWIQQIRAATGIQPDHVDITPVLVQGYCAANSLRVLESKMLERLGL